MGTVSEPLLIDCVTCDGAGCDDCKQYGSQQVIGCPNEVSKSARPVLRLIDLYKNGILPVAGGALDQSAWFLNAVQYFEFNESLISREKQ